MLLPTCRLKETLSNFVLFFFFNDTATPEIYTLSLHDALPIWTAEEGMGQSSVVLVQPRRGVKLANPFDSRSEEHTSELQSRQYLVCRLLLEKKKIRKAT